LLQVFNTVEQQNNVYGWVGMWL